jgi:hypothetical protein
MTSIWIKTIIGSAFLAAAAGALLTMMILMGGVERTGDPAKLRRAHKVFGYAYIALLVPLAVIGLGFIRDMGDGMSMRGILHVVLAEALIAVLLLKWLVVRFFKGFLKGAPALGMALFGLTMVIYFITAGFVLLRSLGG